MPREMPKMVKFVHDECYGKLYGQLGNTCRICWLSGSCESTYKAAVKKEKMEKSGKPKIIREKKYKKTASYRDWT